MCLNGTCHTPPRGSSLIIKREKSKGSYSGFVKAKEKDPALPIHLLLNRRTRAPLTDEREETRVCNQNIKHIAYVYSQTCWPGHARRLIKVGRVLQLYPIHFKQICYIINIFNFKLWWFIRGHTVFSFRTFALLFPRQTFN